MSSTGDWPVLTIWRSEDSQLIVERLLRKEKKMRLKLMTVFLFGILASTVCFATAAENAPGGKAVEMEQMVVSSTKIEKKLENLTDTVTVITADEIKKNNFTDFTEILRFTPGVEFKQAGGPGQFNYPRLRGFGQGHFLVVIDGVKVNEAMTGGVSNMFGHLDPRIIDRIEILRGPQAVLYGSNSTAGVISITTKKGTDKFEAIAGGEGGSLDWRKGYGSLSGPLDNLRYYVYTGYTDSGGVHDDEFYRNFTTNANLSYSFNDVLKLDGTFMYTAAKFGYAELRESYAFDSPTSPWWAFQLPDPHQYSGSDYYLGSTSIEHRINDKFTQKLILGYFKHKTKGKDRYDGYLGSIKAPVDNFTLDWINYYNRGDIVDVYDLGDGKPYYYQNENYTADYNFIWAQPFGDFVHNTFLVGGEFQKQDGKKWGKYGNLGKSVDIYSWYINDQILMFNDSLVFSFGLRQDHHDEFGDHLTGKVGASYTFQELGTTIYSNYGTSFKAPTFSNLYDPRYGNRDLDPEEGETYEFGLRQSLFNDLLEFEVTYWHTDLDDVIAFVYGINPDPNIVGMYDNRDQATTKGVETWMRLRLTDSITFSANYTYTDSKSEKEGETYRTPQVARNKFNLDLSYDTGKFYFDVHGYYTGPRLRWRGDREMDSYFRVDAAARATLANHWTLFGRVENIFDEDIEEGLGYEQPGVYAIAGLEFKY